MTTEHNKSGYPCVFVADTALLYGDNIMDISNSQRAEILTEALPYLRKYNGKIVVIKYGGNAMINSELKEQVMGDIVLLSLVGVKVVLVHGGGPEITEMLDVIGKKSEFIDGLRVTDCETADIVQMVLAGKINKKPCESSWNERRLRYWYFRHRRTLNRSKEKDEGSVFVGEVTSINVKPIP